MHRKLMSKRIQTTNKSEPKRFQDRIFEIWVRFGRIRNLDYFGDGNISTNVYIYWVHGPPESSRARGPRVRFPTTPKYIFKLQPFNSSSFFQMMFWVFVFSWFLFYANHGNSYIWCFLFYAPPHRQGTFATLGDIYIYIFLYFFICFNGFLRFLQISMIWYFSI